MRVLIVTAHKSSTRGKLLGERHLQQVRAAFDACTNFRDRLDILTRTHSQLAEFLPPPCAENEVPDILVTRDRVTALDGIDFVFLDGDDNLLPWARPAAPLLQLLHICLTSGKAVFGCGCAVQLLAYLANVGPVQVPVLNGGGRGGTLSSFAASSRTSISAGSSRPPPSAQSSGCSGSDTGSVANMGAAGAAGLLLEKQTGDLFRFDEQRRAWAPVGNVGVHCSLGAVDRHGVTSSTGINRSDGVGPCDIIQNARFHFLFEGVWPARLVVPETNEWHCHLPTFDTGIQVPTGSFEVKALATSRLGAQIVECRNLVAVQFRPDERFPQTIRMLHNFVDAKVNLLIGEGGQENVHVGRTTKAFASMDGMGATVPLFTTKPPRTSSAPGTSRLAARNAALNMTATADRGASPSPSQLVPRVMAADLVLEDAVTTDKAAVGGPSAAVQRAMAHSQKNAGKPKTKMVRRATGKPFSNYQKYEAKRNALVGHTIHVTSVGPFVSKLEQMNFDEQDKRAASIHKDKYGNYLQFKPGGLWDKWEAPPGGWGFAAAGFLLPDDLPNTHKRYGSFYNVHCHQFRYTKPKQNLYM